MAITKNIVELMGGKIEVASTLGVGTKVTAYLNFERVYHVNAVAEQKTFSDTYLAGKRILLAEDHPLNTKVATKLLEKKGMLVEHAENGQIAVEMLEQANFKYYDAVLMDIRMPVMDGLTAAKAIRALPHSHAKEIPIIAMTATAFEEDERMSKAAGMNAHLAKPIEPKQLYQTLYDFICANKNRQ